MSLQEAYTFNKLILASANILMASNSGFCIQGKRVNSTCSLQESQIVCKCEQHIHYGVDTRIPFHKT